MEPYFPMALTKNFDPCPLKSSISNVWLFLTLKSIDRSYVAGLTLVMIVILLNILYFDNCVEGDLFWSV